MTLVIHLGLSNYGLVKHVFGKKSRSLTIFLHLLSFARLSRSGHLYPSFSILAATFLLQVYLGLSLPRFPCGLHYKACLVMLFFVFLSVCPINLFCLFFNTSSTEFWLVFSHRSWIYIFPGHLLLRMCLRQLFMKTF